MYNYVNSNLFEKNTIKSSGFFLTGTITLEIKNVGPDSFGQYKCYAENASGASVNMISFGVAGKSSMIGYLELYTFSMIFPISEILSLQKLALLLALQIWYSKTFKILFSFYVTDSNIFPCLHNIRLSYNVYRKAAVFCNKNAHVYIKQLTF